MELGILIICTIPTASLIRWVPAQFQLYCIIASCVAFMMYLDSVSLAILLCTMLVVYLSLNYMTSHRLAILIPLLLLNMIFIYYKINVISSINSPTQKLIPLGLSYYIFRQLHLIIEFYKQKIQKVDWVEFISYMLFAPVMIVGPINRFDDWRREIQRRRWDAVLFSQGLERILYGMVKIVILGNYLITFKLGTYIDLLDSQALWFKTYLQCFQYAANAYIQFSGYSDVAIGLSMLFGIRIMENFNFPFIASNINDFWNRWHISLSSWCRDYIFMPFASYFRRPWIGIISSMLVLGLWHEFSYRYLLWALFHGIGIVIWNLFNKHVDLNFEGGYKYLWKGFSILITQNFVIVSFAWIKDQSIEATLTTFKILIGIN